MKHLVSEYDKVARKLIAKLKRGRNEQLHSRHVILTQFGMSSSQARTIEEEITTLIRGMNHDLKRLRGILNTYKDKKTEAGV